GEAGVVVGGDGLGAAGGDRAAPVVGRLEGRGADVAAAAREAGEGGEVDLEDAGVAVARGRGRLEAARLARLGVHVRGRAANERVTSRARQTHRRRRRATRVDHDGGGDADRVADVVGAGERVQVAAGTSEGLCDRDG